MESTNASIEDIDRIEEIATAAFKSTVYYAKPGADLLIQTNKYHKKSNRTLILIMQPLELR